MEDRARYLFEQFINQKATNAERDELFALLRTGAQDTQILDLINRYYEKFTPGQNPFSEATEAEILQAVFAADAPKQIEAKIRSLWPRIAAAACLLIGLSTGAYLLLKQPKTQQVAQNDSEQIAPLQNGVTLTLAKGQQIRLDKKHNGQIATVSGAQINQQDSTLHYTSTGPAEQPATNTLTNNGSTRFSVTLADGTDAILDIGSSLTYPVAFNNKERLVNMTGQVYFKVKHNAAQRFVVRYADQLAEDIGTEFNIDAYPDGTSAKTTLVEGIVKVSLRGSKTAAITLKPGEQATSNGNMLKAERVKLEDITAWLQGKLVFHNEPLESILKKVARIYGVEIIYQDPELRKVTYYGSVNTTKKLATVLNFFRRAGQVDFVVDGKTVKVFKQKRK